MRSLLQAKPVLGWRQRPAASRSDGAIPEESPTGEACIRMARKGASKVEKETREMLLASAKQEFLEKDIREPRFDQSVRMPG